MIEYEFSNGNKKVVVRHCSEGYWFEYWYYDKGYGWWYRPFDGLSPIFLGKSIVEVKEFVEETKQQRQELLDELDN